MVDPEGKQQLMSMPKYFFFSFFLIILLTSNTYSQNTETEKAMKIENSFANERLQSVETWQFKSEEMAQELDIFVSLPFGYRRSQDEYPVLIVLDADVTFGLANDMPKLMAFENTIPSMIVVGISFHTFSNWIQSRQKYLTPSMDATVSSNSGKAGTFLDFIEKELLPFIDHQYRTKASMRVLYGHSYAGLFSIYAMLHANPNSFNAYISTSPSVDWHQQFLTTSLEKIEKEKLPKARLYLSIGDQEDALRPAYDKFVEILENKQATQLKVKKEVIQNTSHMSSMSTSYTNGLLWVLSK